jgi:hypothetical protein
LSDFAEDSDRCAEDDEVGVAHGVGRVFVDRVAEAEFVCALARLGRVGVACDVGGEAATADGVRDGRADEADA